MQRTMKNVVWRREDVEALVEEYRHVDAFALDTETVGTRPPKQLTPKKKDKPALDWTSNRVIWISLATYGRADAIACGHPTGPGPSVEEQMTPWEVVEILKPLLLSDQEKVGHNIKFDFLTLTKYLGEIPRGPYRDTAVEAHLLDENLPSYKLKDLVKRVFKKEYDNLGKDPASYPFWVTARYSRFDALYDWLLDLYLTPRLGRQKVEKTWDLEMEVLEVLIPMEFEGAAIDVEAIEALDKDLRERLAELEEHLYDIAAESEVPPPSFEREKKHWMSLKRNAGLEYPEAWDGTFNLSATADRGWFVYQVRGHKPRMLTEKTKEPSTAEEALRYYEDKDEAVAQMMLWDDIHKLHSTYVHAQRIRLADDGRLHANFKQSGTKTGRFSCSEPNLQNIPRASTPLGKQIRSLFIAPEGYSMVVGDFSQIELRVMAHEADDPAMKRVFLEDRDPHTETARMIMEHLGLDPDKMTSEQRTNYGKTPNFAIVYGAGPAKITASTGMNERDAKAVLEALFASYSRVKPWTQWVVKDCREKLYVRTLFGRKRRLPQIRWADDKLRGYAERQAVNTKIQGSAADINKLAMCRFHRATVGTPHKLILSVHDELVAYTPLDMVEECKAIMKEAMEGEGIQLLSVPLTADINSGSRWSEAK